MAQERTIVFMEFHDLGEAAIVKGALDSNNIPCFLSNQNSPYPGLPDSLGSVRLHIFEKDRKKAEELMDLIQYTAADDDEEERIDYLNDDALEMDD
ncbi:MAG: DUF2007 domain-containing protein [Bacteroidota bacterium]|nr:DUF2007 domain-containing protein [Bacteroidota bacterium]